VRVVGVVAAKDEAGCGKGGESAGVKGGVGEEGDFGEYGDDVLGVAVCWMVLPMMLEATLVIGIGEKDGVEEGKLLIKVGIAAVDSRLILGKVQPHILEDLMKTRHFIRVVGR
jgi:hypothetical protein